MVRWNALAMVVRANRAYGELGGHIASYASAAEIFEMGFNHFFRGSQDGANGDLVYFQPHSAPGVYARAFMEGRLTESQLGNYRQEVGGNGLCSYPHPWLMPEFWQFPTGSMGIGPISAIYQARFMRYLEQRAARRTRARQRSDHSRTRRVVRRRRLECHQGFVGLRLGRPLCARRSARPLEAALNHCRRTISNPGCQWWRVQRGTLLSAGTRLASAGRTYDSGSDRRAQARGSRLSQAIRGLFCGTGASGAAHRDSGQNQERLRHGRCG